MGRSSRRGGGEETSASDLQTRAPRWPGVASRQGFIRRPERAGSLHRAGKDYPAAPAAYLNYGFFKDFEVLRGGGRNLEDTAGEFMRAARSPGFPFPVVPILPKLRPDDGRGNSPAVS